MQSYLFTELDYKVELFDLTLFYLFYSGNEASFPMSCQIDHSELALAQGWSNFEAIDHLGRLQDLASSPWVFLFGRVFFDEI